MIWKKDGFQGERSVILPPALIGMEEDDELCQSLFITDIGRAPSPRKAAGSRPIRAYLLR